MKFKNSLLFIATSAALMTILSQAAAITADGDFADWGIKADGTVAGWTPTAGIRHVVEDQSGGAGTYLSPGYGGQAYDAEALYLTWNKKSDGNTSLYLGLVTGHNPDSTAYGRGDFAIDFGRNGTWDFGVLTKDRTSSLKQNDVVSTTNADWAKGLWSSPKVYNPGASPYVTHVNSGADVGDATVAWKEIVGAMGALTSTDKHWFYEAEIPVSAFGKNWSGDNPSQSFDVQWTMDCANDIITLSQPLTVPEPGSAVLVLLGAGLMASLRRRTTKHALPAA